MAGKLLGGAIQSGTISTTQISSTLNTTIQAGGGPKIASIIYPGDDTAANTNGGQTLYITGSGFKSNSTVYINGNNVPSVSYISASNLSFTGPALSSASYPVYVINPEDGATAILIPGLQVSGEPSWVTGATLSEQDATGTWNISLSATGDAPLTYALAAGSSLPTGISLASNGVISGTITTPPEADTTYNFTVVASDAQNQDSSRAFSVTARTGEGVLFANNVLLIHADGTNNQNNHTFLDSSTNNFTITRNGNPTQGSFSPFSQTGWSNYFDGNGDYLKYAENNSAITNWYSQSTTIEAWVYPTSSVTYTNDYPSIVTNAATSGTTNYWAFGINGTKLRFAYFSGSGQSVQSTGNVSLNAWTHIAFVYNSSDNSIKLYINGILDGSSTKSGSPQSDAALGLLTGGWGGGSFAGYISNLRIVTGTALYTTTFTPPTAPTTAVANTSLLTLQSNRFIDNSTNAFTLTKNGDVSIQAFSPFAPSAAYSTANVGGSGYFDGSGDYLSVADGSWITLGTNDFTAECWIYNTSSTGASQYICGQGNSAGQASSVSFELYLTSTRTLSGGIWVGSQKYVTSTGTIPLNAWTHVALVRDGGNVRIYINGVQDGVNTTAGTSSVTDQSYQFSIGRGGEYNGLYFVGNISGYRFINGTCQYPNGTTFTPPTAPPTAIANTQLLCNFTNAGIFDQTAKNVLETVGDAKVSTAQYKYGTASMYFDGTGDYLKIPNTPAFNLSAGDWTIECWINLSALTAEARIWSLGTYGSNPEVALLIGGGGAGGSSNDLQFNYLGNSTLITASSVNSTGVWMHVAVVRYSGTTTLYVNGVSKGTTATNPWTSSSTSFWIGGWSQNNNQMTGYIDDLRITKGYARYTSNFTAPTAKFKDK